MSYKYVAAVMASAQSHGITKIGLIGAEQFLDQRERDHAVPDGRRVLADGDPDPGLRLEIRVDRDDGRDRRAPVAEGILALDVDGVRTGRRGAAAGRLRPPPARATSPVPWWRAPRLP